MSSILKNLDDDNVFRLSVLLGMIGLLTIYGSSIYIDIDNVNVSEIDRSWSGRNVVVHGEVSDLSRSSGHVFFDLNQGENTIRVVQFDSATSMSEGQQVNVTGHVEIYKGELEIIAKKIES